jgi:hypothetical protein
MKETGIRVRWKAKVHSIIKQETSTLACLKLITDKDKELVFGRVGESMLATGTLEREMVLGHNLTLIKVFMKVIGKAILIMGLESSQMVFRAKGLKGILCMATSMALDD